MLKKSVVEDDPPAKFHVLTDQAVRDVTEYLISQAIVCPAVRLQSTPLEEIRFTGKSGTDAGTPAALGTDPQALAFISLAEKLSGKFA